LPLYAITSSAIIAYRFLTAPSMTASGVEGGEFVDAETIERESAVAS
jgi:hypothetical protein